MSKIIQGLPDAYSANVNINDTYLLTDSKIKDITTNNKNCISVTKKLNGYLITFTQDGSGSIIITTYNSDKIYFGFFINSQKHRICFGSSHYLKKNIWEKNYNDYLYKKIDSTFTEEDIINFVNDVKSLGMSPVIIYSNNIDYHNENYILNYVNKTKNLLRIYKEGILIYEPELFTYDRFNINLIDIDYIYEEYCDLEFFMKEIILSLPPTCDFVYCLNPPRKTDESFKDKNDQTIIKATEDSSLFNIFDNVNQKYIAVKYPDDTLSIDELLTFFLYFKKILEYTNKKGILFYTPVGHINNSLEICKDTNKLFENHTNTYGDHEHIAVPFIFGSKHAYLYNDNIWDDPNIIGDSVILQHYTMLYSIGVSVILFGNNYNSLTSNSHIPISETGGKITDHGYTLAKLKEYYSLG